MRVLLLSCLAVVLGCVTARNLAVGTEDARQLFDEFKLKYGKTHNGYDDEKRFKIFRDNLKRAEEYQSQEMGTAEYGVTKYSDLTAEEFAAQYTNARFDHLLGRPRMSLDNATADIPDSVDWRLKGAVTPVADQGVCGSCWAFSVVGNIEGQWFLKKGQLHTLSKQQLVDCDKYDSGCSGGWPPRTYEEVEKMGGLELESDYPYTGVEGECKLNANKLVAHIDTSKVLTTNEVKQAQWLSVRGPIASALNANGIQFYRRGIVHPRYCSPDGMNHAVLTVGYGVENGVPYWTVKNSWGANWGEQGYFRMYRGDGTCGINRVCSTALIY